MSILQQVRTTNYAEITVAPSKKALPLPVLHADPPVEAVWNDNLSAPRPTPAALPRGASVGAASRFVGESPD